MGQTITAEIRRWAHEDAFVRGDDCPRLTCDEILETLDRLCDEIDGTTKQEHTIDTILQALMMTSGKHPVEQRKGRILARELLIAQMRSYLYAAWRLNQESTEYTFSRALTEAYDATCDVWELHAGDTFDTRVRHALAHVTSAAICDQYRRPIDTETKKGLVCWLIATSRLSMED